jgi:hypothetical protein
LIDADRAEKAIELAEKLLDAPLGIKTLDPRYVADIV